MKSKRAAWRLMGIILSFAMLMALSDPFVRVDGTEDVPTEQTESVEENEAEIAPVADPAVLSQGQQNIVKRAYQMINVRWRPLFDVDGWRYEVTYKAGQTYVGIPYGQPVNAAYVPWDASLLEFVNAVNQPDSKMYTDYSSFTARAPYYSVDCSGFVSYAWDVPYRTPSASLQKWATVIENATYQDLQVGDALCRPGVHASLVTDVVYDSNGSVISVEISEATTGKSTNACCHSIRYGKGGVNTIDRITTRFFNAGYLLMRCNTRDSATYTHSCASPLPGDNCSTCGAGQFTETAVSLTITNPDAVTLYALPNKNSVQIGTIEANSEIKVTASYVDISGLLWYKTADNAWFMVRSDCEHDFTFSVAQEPTCEQAGSGCYTCSICDEAYAVEMPAIGHDYQVTVVTVTCDTPGYTEYSCNNCDHIYREDYVSPEGHDFENEICMICGDHISGVPFGDLNGDDAVDSKDVAYLLRHTLFPDLYPLSQATDYTQDGRVNSKDVVYLLRHILFPSIYPLY